MEKEELRHTIWDHLFLVKGAKTFEEIATATNQDPTVIRALVNHEWFLVHGDRVSIAYAASLSEPIGSSR